MTNMNSQVDFFRSNMRINDNVLHASTKHNVKKVVSMMTTCVFPEGTQYPCNETVVKTVKVKHQLKKTPIAEAETKGLSSFFAYLLAYITYCLRYASEYLRIPTYVVVKFKF